MQSERSSYRPPRRKPAQETLEKLLVSAEEQLREEGLDAFTIQNVLQRAGLSVGAFYSRFPDKTAMLHEVQERVHGRIDSRIQADLVAKQGNSKCLEEAVDTGFGILIHHVLSERDLFRVFMMLSVFDHQMGLKGEQANVERKRSITKLLEPHIDEIGHPDPHLAIDSAYAIYSNTIRGRLVYYGSAEVEQFGVTENVLFVDLKRALALFLRGPAALAAQPNSPSQE
jgi:AcrR family transcriptional regulator